MKKILLLGAGLVSRPLIDYFFRQEDVVLTIASRSDKGFKNSKKQKVIIADLLKEQDKLEEAVKENDLVISLLPYIYHVQVAKLCLKHRKHLVTTSYVSKEMESLSQEAQEKGLLFLNEIGLDPGIDHMSAMKIINEVHEEGGKVLEFRSFCGGLPSRVSNNNPLGYKFSWSPRGVLLAGNNNARYLVKNKVKEISSQDLFKDYYYLDIEEIGTLEVYPNRDSLPYQKVYHLEEAETVFRGTLRNPGWCPFMQRVKELGFLDVSPSSQLKGKTYPQLMSELINWPQNECKGDCIEKLKEKVAEYLKLPTYDSVIHKLNWLGLFDEKRKIPENVDTVLDSLGALLLEKLSPSKEDTDWVVLYHQFLIEDKGGKRKKITSLLSLEGEKGGYSAMARTVALPAAIASHLIVDGKIPLKGVRIPVEKGIYQPVLEKLKDFGIEFIEKVVDV